MRQAECGEQNTARPWLREWCVAGAVRGHVLMPSRSSAMANHLLGDWAGQGGCSGLQVWRQMRCVHIDMARTPSENVCGQPHLTAQPCIHMWASATVCTHGATRPRMSMCTDVQTAVPTQAGTHLCMLSCVEVLPQLRKRGVTGAPKLPMQCSATCVSLQSNSFLL